MNAFSAVNALVSPASPWHAEAILSLLAPEVAAQLERTGTDLGRALERSVLSWSGLHHGLPMCLGGVTGRGCCWMISTPELDRQKRFFLRQTRTVMGMIAEAMPHASTAIQDTWPKSMRWIEWAGFVPGEWAAFPFDGGTARVRVFRWTRP